jgi:4-hydroxythreonine-4-phosphate dehydrogenase
MKNSRIALSIGCPAGVGPEVSVLAAAEASAHVVLVGDLGVVLRAAELRGVARTLFVSVDGAQPVPRGKIGVFQPTPRLASRDTHPGSTTPAAGAAQLAWIDAACDLASSGHADAMVTAPVSKEAIARSGARGSASFRGHTEHLQARLGAREVVMAFWTKNLSISLATTHLPIAAVSRALSKQAVEHAVYWLVEVLGRLKRNPATPRIAVAALNPHAGEGGLLGGDEARAILPGIARARARLRRSHLRADIVGPVAAESAFRFAVGGCFDGVVAMYHDQATIPMKLIGFGEAVNVSLGLPIVRTSVDHGTAYDIAGKGVADARAMGEAIALAARLSGGAGARRPTSREGSRKRRPH